MPFKRKVIECQSLEHVKLIHFQYPEIVEDIVGHNLNVKQWVLQPILKENFKKYDRILCDIMKEKNDNSIVHVAGD